MIKFIRNRAKTLTVALVLVLCVGVLQQTAGAAIVDVGLSGCREGGRTDLSLVSTDKNKPFGVSGGVIFNLPEHQDMTARLSTSDALAWVKNYNGNDFFSALTGNATAKARYSVAFYDGDWNNVWQESGAIDCGK